MTQRILIVDDHKDVIRLLRSAIESLPHELEILEAPSAEEASLELSMSQIDLLVLDYMLPGMTGLELLEKTRKRNQSAEVILISGTKERKARKALEEANVYAFFEKPIPLTEFLDKVERSLGLEPTVIPDEDEAHKTLSALIVKFRQEMNAHVIILTEDYGEIMAKAGSFPEEISEKDVLENLLGIYRSGIKVSRTLGQESPQSYHIFPAGEVDIMLMPVNTTHALIIGGERIADRQNMLAMIDSSVILKSEVAHVLNEILHEEPRHEEVEAVAESTELPDLSDIFEVDAIPEEQIVDEISDEELEALFKQTDLGNTDLDSFWDNAADSLKSADVDSDKLTYEQAKQLGLAPGENN